MSEFSAEFIAAVARKQQFYVLFNFSKLKPFGKVLDFLLKIADQRASPGWQNTKSVISVLKINS